MPPPLEALLCTVAVIDVPLKRTLLGVGPMSVNCVDAVIELANEHDVLIMLIASRRQVDSEEFGGGYVNDWTTRELARYVRSLDKREMVILARDHGGPWQSDREAGLDLRQAMESAKRSYQADLDAGFQVIHIDPSLDPTGSPSVDVILQRIFELYEFCCSKAQHEVAFEIGTEEQSQGITSPEELTYVLEMMTTFCKSHKLPFPTFVVCQTGSLVRETSNVGYFNGDLLAKVVATCNKYKILLKEHNADYLSDDALKQRPLLGVHAANVAPEFGVTESRALVSLLEESGLTRLADHFLTLAFKSGKWKKWMLPDTVATDRERALIAGHYVFSTPACIELREKAGRVLAKRGIKLERYLKDRVKQSVLRYLHNFN